MYLPFRGSRLPTRNKYKTTHAPNTGDRTLLYGNNARRKRAQAYLRERLSHSLWYEIVEISKREREQKLI